jgi:AraC-like DNA-binding protein
MVHVRMDTTDLAIEDRFDAWTELTTRSHVPTIVESSHQGNFVASFESRAIGAMRLSLLSHPPLRARRNGALASCSADVLLLGHVVQGSLNIHVDERPVTATAGSLFAIDVSNTGTVVNPSDVTYTILQIPTDALGLRRAHLRALTAAPMTASEGVGGVIAHILTDLVQHADTHPPALVSQMTSSVVDLLGAAAHSATRNGTTRTMPLPEHSRLTSIYSYIQHRLADPLLSPDGIAAAHAISVRQLNRILREDGQSPSEWIRRLRLDRCRRDLVDPTLTTRPVAAIGSRWGFADPVSFNRAFRRQFGMPPGEYRRRFALDGIAPDLW